jgi:hypothetical protein
MRVCLMLNKPLSNVVSVSPNSEEDENLENVVGLPASVLLSVVERGILARNQVNSLMPITTLGYWVWANMVASIREALIPLGWKSTHEHGLEKVVSSERKIAIVCKSAVQGVGDLEQDLKTRGGSGPVVKQVADDNLKSQIPLFKDDLIEPQLDEDLNDNPMEIWMLIYQVDKENNEVRAELAKPIGYNAQDSLDKWEKRFIIGIISFDDLPDDLSFEGFEQTDEIDIEVERKVNGK